MPFGISWHPGFVFLVLALLEACYTPLDELPAETVATAQWFQEEEVDFGFAELVLETTSCTVLDPNTTRFLLNGMPATLTNFGGRGREPFDAFNSFCAPPRASWERSMELDESLIFRVEDDDNALELRINFDNEILQCDFPSCSALDLMVERPPPPVR